ncbi:hypothetical protein [Streptomyces albidus (ex Kaewkla and Franco 2022)]|uniref:hypothetical protein n=1 Tax=Streptomyces albidus (ex Kaewkla and Franco 2022) TaxID=722709 RepID=UPI001F41C563|nr:hypothetical protein [Streptomyces albidus (ex Kaewkla and Franco 2022)]
MTTSEQAPPRTTVPPLSSAPALVRAPPPRWAVRAAHAAALVTLPSGLWRFALAFGFHAGYTEQGYADLRMNAAGTAYVIALSVVSELLALLTLGLVRPWSEEVPGWVPFLGGRTVRPTAALVPAYAGAAALTAVWTPMLLWWHVPHDDMTATGGALVGVLYLPAVAWGPLLAAVAVSYHRRHRRARLHPRRGPR